MSVQNVYFVIPNGQQYINIDKVISYTVDNYYWNPMYNYQVNYENGQYQSLVNFSTAAEAWQAIATIVAQAVATNSESATDLILVNLT